MPGRAPTRTCVACRTARPKRELTRVVRMPDGTVGIDPTGRAAGRGAYLCRDATCWTAAGRKRAVEHALGAPIPEAVAAVLAAGPDAFNPKPNPTPGHQPAGDPEIHQGGARGQE